MDVLHDIFFGRYFYSPRLAPVINPGLESSASSASFWLRVEDWILVGKLFGFWTQRGTRRAGPAGHGRGSRQGIQLSRSRVAEGWRSGTDVSLCPFFARLFLLYLRWFFLVFLVFMCEIARISCSMIMIYSNLERLLPWFLYCQ